MRRGMRWWKLLPAVLLCALVFTGAALAMGGRPGVPQIRIEDQYGMLSPTGQVGAVFMKIENSGSGDDALLGAQANIPGSVAEIHDVKNGKMVKGEKIDIPAGNTTELKPRGLHIMLFKMPKDTKEGTEFTLTLIFEKSGKKQVPVKFTKASEAGMHHHH